MAGTQATVNETGKEVGNGMMLPALALLGIFAIIGISLGLAGHGGISMMNEQFVEGAESEMGAGIGQLLVVAIFVQSSLTTVFLGPVVGTLGSVVTTRSQPLKTAVATGSVASLVGFFVMVGIAVFIMATALSTGDASGGSGGGGGSSSGLGQVVKPMLYAAAPTAIAGGVGGFIGSRL